MYFLYIDESGYTGEKLDDSKQPIQSMAGLLVNQYHWKKSWKEFKKFCDEFRNEFGIDFKELRASSVYTGSGIWKNISDERHNVIEYCLKWLQKRPHKIISTVINKKVLAKENFSIKGLLDSNGTKEIKLSPYLLTALHIALIFQRYLESQGKNSYKNIGMLIFDEQKKEQYNLQDILISPPKPINGFTSKISKEGFSRIMDNAYFIGSHHCSFIQLADIVAFIIRKYAELDIGISELFEGEKEKIFAWLSLIRNLFIEKRHIYPKNCEFVSFYQKIAIDLFK